jgi:hypothetical protein
LGFRVRVWVNPSFCPPLSSSPQERDFSREKDCLHLLVLSGFGFGFGVGLGAGFGARGLGLGVWGLGLGARGLGLGFWG